MSYVHVQPKGVSLPAIFESRSPVGKAHTSSESGQNSFTGALKGSNSGQLSCLNSPTTYSHVTLTHLQGAMQVRSPVSTPGSILPCTFTVNSASRGATQQIGRMFQLFHSMNPVWTCVQYGRAISYTFDSLTVGPGRQFRKQTGARSSKLTATRQRQPAGTHSEPKNECQGCSTAFYS